MPAAQARAIDRFVSQFTDLAMFDGVVLVDIGGEVVYRQAFGYANFELGVRHTQEHRFRIASVSKAVTDTAIAKLVEAGRLQLDTPIAKFLPNFPSADEIAVRHLLDHTSGIPHTNRQVWGDGTLSLSTTEIIDRLALLPLDFPPGSQSRYSNGGYAVAARILELIDNTTLTEALRRALLRPLGMNSTGHLADSRVAVPNLVTGYEPGKVPGQRRYPRFYAVESRPGGGSLYSTVDDLLRFTRAVFRENYVPAQWRRDVLGADEDVYLSQGRSPGFVAKLFYRASDDIIVISLANNYAVPADWTAAIAGLASSAPIETGWIDIKVVDKLIPVNHPMIGEYSNSFGGGQVSIKRTGEGHLTVTYGNENRATALVPLADGAFLLPLYFQRCHQPKPRGVISCHMLSGNKRYDSILTPR
ncbi:MAG: beta-lactamase family protein [Gammaproteobacteria bacterium]|nr:beta-lactamase family protein [Gammaproteobacteria bacterium]